MKDIRISLFFGDSQRWGRGCGVVKATHSCLTWSHPKSIICQDSGSALVWFLDLFYSATHKTRLFSSGWYKKYCLDLPDPSFDLDRYINFIICYTKRIPWWKYHLPLSHISFYYLRQLLHDVLHNKNHPHDVLLCNWHRLFRPNDGLGSNGLIEGGVISRGWKNINQEDVEKNTEYVQNCIDLNNSGIFGINWNLIEILGK